MDDDRQLMKYLSWLDDLDQDFIFRDTENVLTVRISLYLFVPRRANFISSIYTVKHLIVTYFLSFFQIKMDQDDLTGQPNVDNTLPYDPNVASFDYSNRMMPYNVNETVLTGAMDTTQPNAMPESSYNYNNYLPNGGFYTDAALPQPHIPAKPSEQQFVDMNHTVHAENSYMNASDPQLCTDITANSTNVNVSQESNQYTIPNDVDIKNNFFHEEKHILNDDYSNSQLPMNPISHDVNASANNAFSQINSHDELYSGNSSQEPISIDHTAVDEKPIVGTVQNLNEASNAVITEPPIEIQDDVEVNTKTEPPIEMKKEFKQEEIDLDSVQVSFAMMYFIVNYHLSKYQL